MSGGESPPGGRGERLESWKEIASHLHKDVRTVQRWHAEAGLPVYRSPDTRIRGVFAYAAELDSWMGRGRPPDSALPPSLRWSEYFGRWRQLGLLGLLLGLGGFVLTPLPRPDVDSVQQRRHLTRASELLAAAERSLDRQQHAAAARLLDDAIVVEPDFAVALALRARVGVSEFAPMDRSERLALLSRAQALAPKVAPVDRQRILAELAREERRFPEMAAHLEAVLALDSGLHNARIDLANLYLSRLDRPREAAEQAQLYAAAFPDDFLANAWAAETILLATDSISAATPLVERARAALGRTMLGLSAEPLKPLLPPQHSRLVGFVTFFDSYQWWSRGALTEALAAVQAALADLPSDASRELDGVLIVAGAQLMTLGRLHQAGEVFRRLSDHDIRQLHFAVLADARDDVTSMRSAMSKVPVAREGRAFRFIRAGLLDEGIEILKRAGDDPNDAEAMAEGHLALRQGDLPRAINRLTAGIAVARAHKLSERYLGAESLALALRAVGREEESFEVLEAAAADRPRYRRTGTSGAFWLHAQARLLRDYREGRRHGQAKALERDLRRWLAVADRDHPILRQLDTPAGMQVRPAPRPK